MRQSPRKGRLEALYRHYNSRRYVHPDPVEFLYACEDVGDREIVALLASCLAYGRVVQILRSVSRIVDQMAAPAAFLEGATLDALRRRFLGFRHRFADGEDVARLLHAVKMAREGFGGLENCFLQGLRESDDSVIPALGAFVKELRSRMDGDPGHLLPAPERGSACKRLHLFLRWMVRRDEVDPGGWRRVPAAKLIVPVDTHMHRICRALGLTARSAADGRTALEITAGFRVIAPDDPVRYDFALSRLGIRGDGNLPGFLAGYWEKVDS